MFKRFVLKTMLAGQLKGMPKALQDQVLAAVEAHPQFFEKIAKEVDARVKRGQDKTIASQAVMMQYRSELQQLMQSGK